MHFPECGRRLLEGATPSDGGSLGPRMDLGEREVLEYKANARIVLFYCFQRCVDLAAVRALEIGKFDDGDRGVGRALRRIALDVQLPAIRGEAVSNISPRMKDLPSLLM
jgi:hypothetical protein